MNEESHQPTQSEGIRNSLKKIIKTLKLWGQGYEMVPVDKVQEYQTRKRITEEVMQDMGVDPNNLDKISEETRVKIGKERDRRLGQADSDNSKL